MRKVFVLCLVIGLVFAGGAAHAADVAKEKGLVAYWSFDEGKGDIVKDQSGNNNDGEIDGCEWVKGKVSTALVFPGDGTVDCGNNESLDIADAITISVWINLAEYTSGYASHPVLKWTDTNDANIAFYLFGNHEGAYQTNEGNAQFYANAGGEWASLSDTYKIAKLNTWYNIVWTYDAEKGGQLYVNGVKSGKRAAGKGQLAKSESSLKIGADGFNGIIDELKIYNIVLSPGEIKAYYEKTK